MRIKTLLLLFGISLLYSCAKYEDHKAPAMEFECISHQMDDSTRIIKAHRGDTIKFKLTITGDNLNELRLHQVSRLEVRDIYNADLKYLLESLNLYNFPNTEIGNEMVVYVICDENIATFQASPLHNFAFVAINNFGEITLKYARYEEI